MSTHVFEYAARNKLRFPSIKGDLTAEQLWDVPLRSTDGFNLDTVAKGINKTLKALSEESFVETAKHPGSDKLEVAMDVVKHVIQVRLDEETAASKRAENKVEKEKLLRILAEKQEGKLSDLTEKELQKRISALDA